MCAPSNARKILTFLTPHRSSFLRHQKNLLLNATVPGVDLTMVSTDPKMSLTLRTYTSNFILSPSKKSGLIAHKVGWAFPACRSP